MEKRKLLITLIVSALSVSFIFLIIFIYSLNIKSSPVQLQECKAIRFNGNDKINLVFFSDKNTAERYTNHLMETTPIRENKDKFNFFYIDSYKPDCKLYKEIALLCYSKDLIKTASSCPNDYVVVVEKQSPEIRSSSYMNVMSINSRHPSSVLTHEFGHAFANLAEEYVPARLPREAKNCVSSCSEFSEIKDGCFEGCSRDDYTRSIENGVMRTLESNAYGKFNSFLVQSRINENTEKNSKITGSVISPELDCENQKYFLITGVYQNQEVRITSREIADGCVGSNGFGEFKFNVILKDGQVIHSGDFNAELIFTDSPATEANTDLTGEIFENSGEFILKIPILEKAAKLQIIYNGKIGELKLNDIGARPCRI
ncbi:hypothetical protein HYV50_00625 [Candidatus Pacearchaeota archaeon]|nr:hypothetical protein [Candidatus Pacearchaeota archaeon]